MRNRITGIVTLLCAALCTTCFAAGGMFSQVQNYEAGIFGDVTQNDWFASEVAAVYSTGLMNGTGDGVFSPNGTVTVAQAVTLASRLNSVYNGKQISESGSGNWYDAYVDYAKTAGFITASSFDSYDRPITRIEMTTLFADALPSEYYSAINSVTSIPDVAENNPGFAKLLMLYNAGIALGNDDYGTFYPNNSIRRSEVAAIVNRVANPENRLKGSLYVSARDTALVLVEDNEMSYHGWQRDTRGMSYMTRLSTTNDVAVMQNFSDVSTQFPTIKYRNFREQTTGVLCLVSNIILREDADDFYISINDRNGNDVVRTNTKNGYFFVGDKQVYKYAPGSTITVKMSIDLDNGVFDLYFNDTSCGRFEITSKKASRLELGYTDKGTGYVNISGTNLTYNYYVSDHFLGRNNGVDWNVSSTGTLDAGTVSLQNSNYSNEDIFSYKITNHANSVTTAAKTFRPAVGNIGFEVKFLLPAAKSGVSFTLGTALDGFTVTTDGTDLVAPDGTVIGAYAPNVWTTVRAEVDVTTGKAMVRINGKDKGEFAVSGSPVSFGSFTVSANTATDTELLFDDVLVYPVMPEPADYVKAPVPVQSDDSYLGMNTCNLWRFGYWRSTTSSWQVCSAFDELTPYLGYYDDGNPEVSDWEIKWFAEHGIDYQLQCWYGPATGDAPVKTPGFSQNLHDGYFNAKYKDYSKFAIMWENNFTGTIDSNGFRNNFVPFWIEYYFKDPNYFVIDNKPVFSIYNFSRFVGYFGSNEAAKAEIDYLRSEVQKLGFDDIILMFAGAGGDLNAYNSMAFVGAEGAYNYNLGKASSSADFQKSAMENNAKKGASSDGCYYVPTISMGFNNVARGDTRSDNITIPDYKIICDWTKNTLMKNSSYYDQSNYMSKMILLSCWNEYDEGHYLNPSNLHGFEYIDVLRDVFATGNAGAHTDDKPTAEQVSRVQVLFPDNYSMLRPLRWYKYNSDNSAALAEEIGSNERVMTWDFTKAGSLAASKWTAAGATAAEGDGCVEITSAGGDPIFWNQSINLDISTARYVHVRIKSMPEGAGDTRQLQVFFRTEASPNWASDKCVSVNAYKVGEWVDVYADMSQNTLWNGVLTSLRVDGFGELGKMQIERIELIKDSGEVHEFTAVIDGKAMTFEFPVDTANGVIVPFVPGSGIFGAINSSYAWSRFSGKLDMMIGNVHVEFTVGSDKAVVDGVEKQLSKAISLTDGIPMLPLDKISEFCGFTYSYDGKNTVTIETPNSEEAHKINDYLDSRKPYQYDFEIDGNNESWGVTNSCIIASEVSSGSYYLKSNGIDPNISLNNTGIDADVYKKCIIRMKTDVETNQGLALYFANASGGLDEKKTVKASVLAADKDYVVYELDMSKNTEWTGKIGTIRFDPFTSPGECWIDYIRFTE